MQRVLDWFNVPDHAMKEVEDAVKPRLEYPALASADRQPHMPTHDVQCMHFSATVSHFMYAIARCDSFQTTSAQS